VLAASVCSLITALSSTFSDADHSASIAEHWTATLDESVRRIDAFRDAHPEHPIIDIQYADLVGNPPATVDALYAAMGEGLGAPARSAMHRYLEAHPRGEWGAHTYDLASYGLDAARIRDRFADYSARYDIPSESTTTPRFFV
jgi:hypothetical protein